MFSDNFIIGKCIRFVKYNILIHVNKFFLCRSVLCLSGDQHKRILSEQIKILYFTGPEFHLKIYIWNKMRQAERSKTLKKHHACFFVRIFR